MNDLNYRENWKRGRILTLSLFHNKVPGVFPHSAVSYEIDSSWDRHF